MAILLNALLHKIARKLLISSKFSVVLCNERSAVPVWHSGMALNKLRRERITLNIIGKEPP